jgi:hypothetical protein
MDFYCLIAIKRQVGTTLTSAFAYLSPGQTGTYAELVDTASDP